MTILSTIKAAQLAARKAREADTAASLTTLIGEAEAVGKKSNRDPSDAEVTAMLKKFIANASETHRMLSEKEQRLLISGNASERFAKEVALYTTFLPKQLTAEELEVIIAGLIADRRSVLQDQPLKMGVILQDLKQGHEGEYDGKLASELVKAALA